VLSLDGLRQWLGELDLVGLGRGLYEGVSMDGWNHGAWDLREYEGACALLCIVIVVWFYFAG